MNRRVKHTRPTPLTTPTLLYIYLVLVFSVSGTFFLLEFFFWNIILITDGQTSSRVRCTPAKIQFRVLSLMSSDATITVRNDHETKQHFFTPQITKRPRDETATVRNNHGTKRQRYETTRSQK